MNPDYYIHRVGERIDTFNIEAFKKDIETQMERGQLMIGLDLHGTKFLSIPCIKLIVSWANGLHEQGGHLMLMRPTEKLRRQVAIFGSLDRMVVKKSPTAPAEPSFYGSPGLDESLDF